MYLTLCPSSNLELNNLTKKWHYSMSTICQKKLVKIHQLAISLSLLLVIALYFEFNIMNETIHFFLSRKAEITCNYRMTHNFEEEDGKT